MDRFVRLPIGQLIVAFGELFLSLGDLVRVAESGLCIGYRSQCKIAVHLHQRQDASLQASLRSPDLWENEVAPISVIGTAGEGVDELEVGPGVRQLGGVELG